MTNDHLTAEDQWFKDRWAACGRTITETLETARSAGPFACANVERLSEKAMSSGWDQADELSGGSARFFTRSARPLRSFFVEADIGAEEDRMALIVDLTTELAGHERDYLVRSLVPQAVQAWPAGGGSLNIGEIVDSGQTHHLLINVATTSGKLLAAARPALAGYLGGEIIEHTCAPDLPHLFVPDGCCSIHVAGRARYERPTAGRFRIETVVGVTMDEPEAIVALAGEFE